MGDPNMAAFAKQGVLLENYFGVTHPSEPNYVASISGDNFGMDNDNFNSIPQNVSTIVDLLEARGISWGEYQEDMPYTGFEGYAWLNQTTHANDYVRKHNPAVIYQANDSPERLSVIKNFTRFQQDLASNSLPQWAFITPNMTDDAHDSSVTVAGQFLQRWLTPLLKNPNFMKRTLVLITFDENHTYSEPNRVMSILLGDAVPEYMVGTTDDTVYTHYSEIATVTANWNLSESITPRPHMPKLTSSRHPRSLGRRCKRLQDGCRAHRRQTTDMAGDHLCQRLRFPQRVIPWYVQQRQRLCWHPNPEHLRQGQQRPYRIAGGCLHLGS